MIYEGIPTYPRSSMFSEIIDQHQVTSFNTAPTALRAMMQYPEQSLVGTSRKSLKLLGVFGEVLNKDAWLKQNMNFTQKYKTILQIQNEQEI